jgi:hypothetical protein
VPPRRLPLLAAAAVPGLLLAACGSSIGQDELETQVAGALASRAGVTAEVSCPGDLDAEVGVTTECRAVDPDTGEATRWQIVVISVEDDMADFDIARVD